MNNETKSKIIQSNMDKNNQQSLIANLTLWLQSLFLTVK